MLAPLTRPEILALRSAQSRLQRDTVAGQERGPDMTAVVAIARPEQQPVLKQSVDLGGRSVESGGGWGGVR